MVKCEVHGTKLICPTCIASTKSPRKTAASRKNGWLGGRPRLPDNLLTRAALRQRRFRSRIRTQQQVRLAKGVYYIPPDKARKLDEKEKIKKTREEIRVLEANLKQLKRLEALRKTLK